jgi:hypothetical protein
MTADRLLRFYPRPWRDRYGTEFLETVGPGALQAPQVIDIAMGAVDAWLSADVRRSAVGGSKVSDSGGRAMLTAMKGCDSKVRYTTGDLVLSAVVLMVGTAVLAVLGVTIGLIGHAMWGDILQRLAFPIAMVVSLPFGILKGQPRRAQAVVLGVTSAVIIGVRYFLELALR